MSNTALILAGGQGTRMEQDIPKQFMTIKDRPLIVHTLEIFHEHPEINSIAVVCLTGWENFLRKQAEKFKISKLKYIFPGGETSQTSISNGVFGLEKILNPNDVVLIHTANRPFVSFTAISDCIAKTRQYGSSVAVVPVSEPVIKIADKISSEKICGRDKLRLFQTPTGFVLKNVCELYRKAFKQGLKNSFMASTLQIEIGEKIYFCKGSRKNIKLTFPEDIEIFETLLANKKFCDSLRT